MKDDLVEQAERAYEAACCRTCDEQACNGFTCLKGFRAILAIARPAILEEAASIAESLVVYQGGRAATSIAIAAAIRAIAEDSSHEN